MLVGRESRVVSAEQFNKISSVAEQKVNTFRFTIDFLEMKMQYFCGRITMAATVHILHAKPPAIGSFLRVGHTGHRKLESLTAASRLRFRRFVFDAAYIEAQGELLGTLRRSGCEIVLDPNLAETATPGRFDSSVSALPWGNADRPWEAGDYGRNRNHDTAQSIAEFALKHNIDAVLAPTHWIEVYPNPWTSIDLRLCEELRHELDRAGGKHIAIDYQLITTNTLLKDGPTREALAAGLRHAPVENIWLRSSGFGATATGTATRAFIEAAKIFHEIGKPIIADYAGGFSALAAAAFGGIGGLCHGMGQKETFRMGDWRKRSEGGGGSTKRIYVPELDRFFTEGQLGVFFSVRGTKARFGCNDTTCCAHGTEDMSENHHRHFAIQRSNQIKQLSEIPETRRAEHFLLHVLDPAVRSARLAARLKFGDEDMSKLVLEAKKRLINLRDPLGDLHANSSAVTRSLAPRFRGENKKSQSVAG